MLLFVDFGSRVEMLGGVWNVLGVSFLRGFVIGDLFVMILGIEEFCV